MQKATLLTLALSVSALFASAQSYTAEKVYSIKNKKHGLYAAAMPRTNLMAVSKATNLNLSELFTITPVDGSTDVYTIKPYVDDSKYVYYINTNDANANVGLTTTEGENTKWTITTSSTEGFMLIKPGNGQGSSWNKRGMNTDWDMDAIGQWIKNTDGTSADLTDDNKWAITEVTANEVTAAVAAYKDAYINFYANLSPIEDAKKTQIGYATNLNEFIEKAKVGTKTGATNSEVYNAAVNPNEVNWNLPVDGKVYKIYGLYRNGDKIYAGTKSGDEPKYYVAQKTSGTNFYRFVSTTADAEALSYNNQNDFPVGVANRLNLGALTLKSGNYVIAAASDGTLNHFSNSGKNDYENKGVKYSTEMYFEEVTSTDYAGHPVTFTKSTDGKAYATLNLPFATTIPEGVTAYKKGESTVSSVKLEEYNPANNVLPANTPVLLQADEAGEKTFAPAEYVAKDNTTGFSGTLAAANVSAENVYILAKDGDAVKFCKLNATNNKVNANKAYFTLTAAAANALNFDFGGVTTGIENAVANKANNAPIYDLSGRRVMNAVKGGIYIQNGKKFVK